MLPTTSLNPVTLVPFIADISDVLKLFASIPSLGKYIYKETLFFGLSLFLIRLKVTLITLRYLPVVSLFMLMCRGASVILLTLIL